jgi:hypothetical protein
VVPKALLAPPTRAPREVQGMARFSVGRRFEAEQGWQKALDKIGERAGLTKGPDGTWRDPSMSEAA